jgi:hypothetical protein
MYGTNFFQVKRLERENNNDERDKKIYLQRLWQRV